MKIISLLSVLSILGAQAHADLLQALDPWGNRKNAGELRAKTDDLRQQRSSAQQRLADLEKERATKKGKLDGHRAAIADLKDVAKRTLRDDAGQLEMLLIQQKTQVEVAHGIAIEAEAVSKAAQDASLKMSQIRDHAQAAQVLAPLFRNSAENRALWIAAIEKVEANPQISAPEFKALKKLRAQLGEQEAAWHWQRTSALFEEYTATIESLQGTVAQKLIDNLSARAAKLAVEAKTQFDIQAKLVEVLTKLKTDHEAMRNAFNL